MDLEVAMIYMQCVFTWFVPMFVLEVGGGVCHGFVSTYRDLSKC